MVLYPHTHPNFTDESKTKITEFKELYHPTYL
jgi:hypothetical protein